MKLIKAKVLFFLLPFLLINILSTYSYSQSLVSDLVEGNDFLRLKVVSPLFSFDTIYSNDRSFYLLPNFKVPVEKYTKNNCTFYIVRGLIALPDSNGFSIENLEVNVVEQIKGNFVSPEKINIPNDSFSRFDNNAWALNSWANLRYIGIGRNLHLGLLQFVVGKYNWLTKTFNFPREFNVTIRFFSKKDDNFYSNFKDEIFSNVLNFNQAKRWIIGTNQKSVITKDGLVQLSPNTTFIKIKVEKEGIYKIDAASLSSLGANITPDLIPTLKIFGRDGKPLSEKVDDALKNNFTEIPIIVRTKSDGSLDYILFYGSGTSGFEYSNKTFRSYQNPYSNVNYYFLFWGGTKGLRIETIPDTLNCENVVIPDYYTERIQFREEITNPFNSGSGRIWFGGSIFPRTFVNLLPDLYRDGEIFYRFYVAQSYLDNEIGYYGKFSFYEAQNLLAKIEIGKLSSYEEAIAREVTATFLASSISSDNRSYLKIEYQNPKSNGSATPFFNFYEIHYPRRPVAIDNSISIFSIFDSISCYELQITGFTDGEIIGLNVTDPKNPSLLTNRSVVKNSFAFRFFNDSLVPRRFYISSNFLKPDLAKVTLAGLRDPSLQADVIVITHSDMLNSATKFKTYRENSKNLKVMIVTVEDIYNEFSFGVTDPTAIRDFVAYAVNNWSKKPKFLVLWGDGHFDFRNISTKQTNYIPAFQIADNPSNFYSTISFTSDDYYGCVVGNDDVIDIVVARVPIYDDETGLTYIDKIITYENSSTKSKWRSTVLFCADDSPQSGQARDGNQHTKDSEFIANGFVPKDMFVKKLYLPEYPTENVPSGRRKPLATNDLIRTINDGVLLVNWLGHGNPRVWAHEELFDRDRDISLLSNLDNLFFGIAATCDFGRFDMVNIKSGVEELLFYPNGGAIAYLAATRPVYVSDNANLNRHFVANLFQRDNAGKYLSLGEVNFAVKQLLSGDNDMKYLLFGDPLIVLNIPELVVKIDKVNGNYFDSLPSGKTYSLKAFSILDLEGSIRSYLDSSILSNFNGNVEIIINDVGFTKKVVDIDGTIHSIYKEGGIISKGIFPVVNGKFTGKFYITDEVSFLDGNISIRFFAKDTTNNLFAKGVENRLTISGIDTLFLIDNQPPSISIYLDDTTFVDGDVVSNPPFLIVRLFDNTAINTTGVGIGHLIEAWIDDKPESINLTDKYESSPFNPQEGFIKTFLNPLDPGEHKIKVRAWDIFNNYSFAETHFKILDADAGILLFNPIVFPQPGDRFVVFRVQHNISQPYNVTLKVFNTVGELIYQKIVELSRLRYFELTYDCIDDFGNAIPTGIYHYQITVSSFGKSSILSGKFAIVK